jgi:hypothetical protein
MVFVNSREFHAQQKCRNPWRSKGLRRYCDALKIFIFVNSRRFHVNFHGRPERFLSTN